MRVAVIADSGSRAQELKRMLAIDPEMMVNARTVSEQPAFDEDEADVVVWEPSPGEEGWDVIERQSGESKIILLTDTLNENLVADVLRSGIKAVLPAKISAEQLVAAVRAVGENLIVLESEGLPLPARTPHFRNPPPVESLTNRESEILTAIADGLTNKDIASRLHISEHTVKFHVATILSKLGASSRTEAVTIALRQGLLMI